MSADANVLNDDQATGEIRLRFHGTGAGHPSADRYGSGATIETGGGQLILIDAGDSVPRRLIADGVDPLRVGWVLLSHWHPDHWSGLPGLVMTWDISGRRDPAAIFVPPGSSDFLRSLLRYSWLEVRDRSYDLRVVEYLSDSEFEAGPAVILPSPTSHLTRYHSRGAAQGLSFPAHLFRIEIAGTTLLFSQDIGAESDLDGRLGGVRHVVCESSHVDPLKIIEAVRGAGDGRLYFTHIPPDREAELAQIAKSTGGSNENGPVIVAYDGLEIVIRAEHS